MSIRDSYLDSEDFAGSLPVIFQGALAFIMRNLRKIQKQKGFNTIGDKRSLIPLLPISHSILKRSLYEHLYNKARDRDIDYSNCHWTFKTKNKSA